MMPGSMILMAVGAVTIEVRLLTAYLTICAIM